MPSTTIKYFAYAHLPVHLQAVSKPIGLLAEEMEQHLPDGPEKSAGMRKLLEAKDCFVRSALDLPPPSPLEQAMANAPRSASGAMIVERLELGERLDEIKAYEGCPAFADLDAEDQRLIRAQREAMEGYSDLLGLRILRYKPGA